MPAIIELTDAGLATLAIADADGELWAYRFGLAPVGSSLWALNLTRADTDASYRVAEESPGRWTCTCPAQTYRKRGAPPCKHIGSARALRAFLRSLEEPNHERTLEKRAV